MEKISIIVPVYNVRDYVGNTIESLLNQHYSNIELILINDGSTDDSLDILQSYARKDNRIVIIDKANGGTGSARNAGLKIASGNFISFVDGDDMLSCDALSENIQFLLEDTAIDWVLFPVIKKTDNQKIKDYSGFYPDQEKKIYGNENIIHCYVKGYLSGLACGSILRKKTFKNIFFPEKEFYEDSFFFTDMIATSKGCVLSNRGAYYYVQREGSAQLKGISYDRLVSKLHNLIYRNALLRKSNIYENYCNKTEEEFYYYLKTEKAKGIEYADDIKSLLLKGIDHKIRINLSKELKILIYKIVGYKKLYSIWKRYIEKNK